MHTTPDEILVGPPHLFGDEPALLDRALTSAAAWAGSTYLEFGMGGSTVRAAAAGFTRIVSVDSVAAWANAVRVHLAVAPLIAAGRAHILHADIGPVGQWGRPVDARSMARWPDYVQAPLPHLPHAPNLVFVDGRFRVACCAVAALLALGEPARETAILLHDVGPERPQYDAVLGILESVEATGSLHRLRVRPDATVAMALSLLMRVQFDPA